MVNQQHGAYDGFPSFCFPSLYFPIRFRKSPNRNAELAAAANFSVASEMRFSGEVP